MEALMKPFVLIPFALALAACVPDMPVDAGLGQANAGGAENACRAQATRQGLGVQNISAFREVTGANGPSGMQGIVFLKDGGEARCDFSYADGRATVTPF
jgi:hypothetical protein